MFLQYSLWVIIVWCWQKWLQEQLSAVNESWSNKVPCLLGVCLSFFSACVTLNAPAIRFYYEWEATSFYAIYSGPFPFIVSVMCCYNSLFWIILCVVIEIQHWFAFCCCFSTRKMILTAMNNIIGLLLMNALLPDYFLFKLKNISRCFLQEHIAYRCRKLIHRLSHSSCRYNDSNNGVKDVGSLSNAEDFLLELFPLQVKIFVSWETTSLEAKISQKVELLTFLPL